MGLELSLAYYRRHLIESRQHNLGAAYVFSTAQRVLDRYSVNLEIDERERALAELHTHADRAFSPKETEAWTVVFSLYQLAMTR